MITQSIRTTVISFLIILSIITLFHQRVLAEDRYAIFAYSPTTGKFGVSYNFQNLDEARKNALSGCKNKSRSKDCREVLQLGLNQCGALALSANNPNSYGVGSSPYGWNSGFSESQKIALKNCGSKNCVIFLTVCHSNETKVEYMDCKNQLTNFAHRHVDNTWGDCYERECIVSTFYYPIRKTPDGFTKVNKKVWNCGLIQ